MSGGRPGSFEVLEGLGPWGVDTKLGEFPSKCSKDWVSGGRPGSFEVLEGLGPWGVDTTLGEFPSKCSKDRVGVRRLVLEGLGRSNVDTTLGEFPSKCRRTGNGWVSGGPPGSLEVLEGLGRSHADTTLGEFPSKCSKDWVSVGRPGSFEVLEGLGPWGVDTTLGEFPSKCSKDWVGVRRSTRFLRSARRNSIDRTSTQRWASFLRSVRRNGWVSGRRPGSFEVLKGLRRSNVDTTLVEFPSKCSKDSVDPAPTQRWASFLRSARRTGWVSGGRPGSFEVIEGLGGCPAVDQVPSKCWKGLGRSNVDTTLGEFPSKCSKGWVVVRGSTRFLRSARRNSVDRTSTQRWASFLPSARRAGWLSGGRPKCSKGWVGVRRSTRFLRSARRN